MVWLQIVSVAVSLVSAQPLTRFAAGTIARCHYRGLSSYSERCQTGKQELVVEAPMHVTPDAFHALRSDAFSGQQRQIASSRQSRVASLRQTRIGIRRHIL